MLLKNIIAIKAPAEFIAPLPYYDQAEPVVASLFLKMIMTVFHYDIRSLRFSVLTASVVMFLPMCLLYKKYRWGLFVLLIALIGNSFSMGFQVTELKHYFLEVSASFLAILAIWKAEETRHMAWLIVGAAVVSVLGFSTLLVSGGLLGYAVWWFLTRRDDPQWRINGLLFVCALLIVGFSYGDMKHLTVYQLGNYSQYKNSSFSQALAVLSDALLGAYGKALLVISIVSSAALWVFNDRGFIFKLNVFFCALLLVVVAGKVLGFYPVTYPRHVIWLVPFSLVISSLATLEFTASPSKTFKVLGWLLFTLLSLQAMKACYKNAQGDNYEFTDNAALYGYIAQMPTETILVHPNAQPSLEFYRLRDPQLSHQHFIVARDEQTKVRAPAMEGEELRGWIDDLFRQRPAGPFYFLTSHLNLQAGETGQGVVLESEIRRFNCTYSAAFAVNDAQLLLMNCGAAHEQ
ncbi:hypothetical protein [Pseudomonas sp. NA-150]|uniref:hypothetical protein n=1 Tax=Pseudomonas sp. NA-150 TaxID=3367525 RepID=UPI0037C791E6